MNRESRTMVDGMDPADAAADGSSRSLDAVGRLSLQLVAEHLPHFVWLAAPDGNFTYHNELMRQYVGPTACQCASPGWLGQIDEDQRNQVSDLWSRSISTGEAFEAEVRLNCADQTQQRWFLARATPDRQEDGTIRAWFGTCTDIHQQKTAEAELRSAKELSDKNGRVKDEFLSILSHELRTPLSAILGWTQLLEMGALDEAETVEAVQIIKQQAKLQSQLIEDLLEVSRIINGKFHMRRQVMEVRQVMQAAVDSVRAAAEARKVKIDYHASDDLGLVEGDPQRMQQVAWNLLTNAIKFSPEGGTVRVRLDRADSSVRITVADDGKGIPPEHLGAIFDRFKQLDTGAARIHGGLGLGLSIARHIVERHGGTIAADSAGLDQGSTFLVMLPVAAVQPQNPYIAHKITQDDGTPTLDGIDILVVDDEESARTVVAACLKKFGANVSTARGATEALDMLASQSARVLVSDISMPVQNGFDLIRAVRGAGQAFSAIPAIALTAFASIDDQTRALDAGFNVHVSKPVDQAELVRQVLALTRMV